MVRLDERITFQAESRTADSMGGASRTWADYTSFPTVWARVAPMRGTEELNAERVDATAMYTFIVRYRSDVSENDRIVWRDEYYNIRMIERRGGRPLYLYIHAERGVGN